MCVDVPVCLCECGCIRSLHYQVGVVSTQHCTHRKDGCRGNFSVVLKRVSMKCYPLLLLFDFDKWFSSYRLLLFDLKAELLRCLCGCVSVSVLWDLCCCGCWDFKMHLIAMAVAIASFKMFILVVIYVISGQIGVFYSFVLVASNVCFVSCIKCVDYMISILFSSNSI